MSGIIINPYVYAATGATEFIIKVKTDNTGSSADNQFTIPTTGAGYSYDVDWGDTPTATDSGVTGNITHTYAAGAGTYEIKISGTFPRIYFNRTGDKLKLLEIMNWGTIAWTSMAQAFYECDNMTITATDAPDLSSVTSLLYMFRECDGLTNHDLTNWDTSNITSMNGMFFDCDNLASLDISTWDVSAVTDMDYLFYTCPVLTTTGDLSSWDTSALGTGGGGEGMRWMFRGCYDLTNIGDISSWDISSVISLASTFRDCRDLTTLNDVGSWDVSSVSNFVQTFEDCRAVTTLDLNSWDMSSAGSLLKTFKDCFGLTSLNIKDWDVSGVTSIQGMLTTCYSLTTLDVSDWNVSNVTTMQAAFKDMTALTALDLETWNTTNVIDIGVMFYDNTNITTIGDVSSWDTSAITNMDQAFYNCDKLTMDVSGWDTSSAHAAFDMYRLFYSCSGSGSITGYENWDVTQVKKTQQMFQSTTNLTTFPGDYELDTLIYMKQMFYNAGCVTGSIDCTGMKWSSSVIDMNGAFRNNSGLTDISFDSANLDFSGVTTMQNMFYSCDALIDVTWHSGLDLSALTNATNMFTSAASKMSPANYDIFLIALDAGSGTPGTLDTEASQYNAGAGATAHASLLVKGWTINDGGQV